MLPGQTIHGRAEFAWADDGAFVRMSSRLDDPNFPAGVSYIGSDNEAKTLSMIYFDDRGVSRLMKVSIEGRSWRWWRDHPGFSQRYLFTLSDDGRTITGRGELSRDDKTWEPDLQATYTRE
jgi:hypothetical protein